MAFLERRPGPADAQRISGEEALDRLLADMPSYGEEVDELHERAVRRLAEAPAYRRATNRSRDGVELISAL